MTEWSEEWVRGITGWKPFKEGKTLFGDGRVENLKIRESLCQGVIRDGRVVLRPTIKVTGPSDVGVQCGCPDNRSTGGVCAHAVAVLLATIAERSGTNSKTKGENLTAPAGQVDRTKAVARARIIRLSGRFREELAAGRLSVRLLRTDDRMTAPDERLSEWLSSRKSGDSENLLLQEETLAEFLDAISGHPRVEVGEGDNRTLLAVEPDPCTPLPLLDSRESNGQIHLLLNPPAESLFFWGACPALAGNQRLVRLPTRSTDTQWRTRLRELLASGKVVLPVREFVSFFDTWTDLFQSSPPGWLGTISLQRETPTFFFEFEGSLETISGVLKVSYYGQMPIPIPSADAPIPGLPRWDPERQQIVGRQLIAERQAIETLKSIGFQSTDSNERFQIEGKRQIFDWISDGIQFLEAQGWTLRMGAKIRKLTEKLTIVRPQIEILNDQGSSLEFELSFQTANGEQIAAAEVRRLLRSGQRATKRKNGAILLSKACGDLADPLMEDLQIQNPDGISRIRGPAAIAIRNTREYLLNSGKISLLEIPEKPFEDLSFSDIQAQLRPYQTQGAAWLIDRLKTLNGAILADEMGLGKTIQAIASINHFNQINEGTSLIVVPASLVDNWQAELSKFAPHLSCVALHGSDRDRLRETAQNADIVVTSYSTLVRDLAYHLKRVYCLVVADEASLIRNATTDTAKSLCKLQANARLALTGTPIENRIGDLWSLFQFVAPGYLGTFTDFKARYEGADQDSRSALQRLRLRISPFVLRRTKAEVAKDLPEKIEVDEWLTLDPEQERLYATLARSGLNEIDKIRREQGAEAGRMHLLTLLLRLRQTCVNPGLLDLPPERNVPSIKLQRLGEILNEQFESGKKTLVFSQFAENLRQIEQQWDSRYGKTWVLDGSSRNRLELVEEFQRYEGPAVFLISLKAGGYGLNLTAANTVIHLDPWWNPAVEAQATDRAHRIGQTEPVTVFRLLTKNTVEERVRRMQASKNAVIETMAGGGEHPTNWSMEDLEGLLR